MVWFQMMFSIYNTNEVSSLREMFYVPNSISKYFWANLTLVWVVTLRNCLVLLAQISLNDF